MAGIEGAVELLGKSRARHQHRAPSRREQLGGEHRSRHPRSIGARPSSAPQKRTRQRPEENQTARRWRRTPSSWEWRGGSPVGPAGSLRGLLKKFRMTGVTTEVQWSELQRDPKGVAALADQGDVRVRRRDGVPLLLVREDSATSAVDGALSAARTLRNALAHLSADDAANTLMEEFPWVDLLPDADRRRFAADFVRAVGASAELGRWSVLAQVLVEWKATAAIYADPALVEELTRPLEGDLGPVPAPGGS